jgi:hypothetical protein
MAEERIFPTRLADKSAYFNQCIPYCDANKVRLGIDVTKIGGLVTGLGTWNGVYPDSINKNLTTKTLRDQRDNLIPEFENGLREIYKDIPQSKLTDADRNTLNLKKPDTTKTPRPKITDVPFAKIAGKDGALMEVTCRTSHDSSRPSIHEDADGVELVYIISDKAPASPGECTKTIFRSRAKFLIQLDIAEAGKHMYGYVRWKNNSDDNKSGPYSAVNGMISE